MISALLQINFHCNSIWFTQTMQNNYCAHFTTLITLATAFPHSPAKHSTNQPSSTIASLAPTWKLYNSHYLPLLEECREWDLREGWKFRLLHKARAGGVQPRLLVRYSFLQNPSNTSWICTASNLRMSSAWSSFFPFFPFRLFFKLSAYSSSQSIAKSPLVTTRTHC